MRSELAVVLIALAGTAHPQSRYGVGRPPTTAELKAWDIDVRGDGRGLPPGRGSVAQGAIIFAAKCAGCHGGNGKGGAGPALVGGIGTLASKDPVKTVGSYWPFAPTVYDYIHRAMPYNAPQSLSPDQTYAVTAYVLRLNGLVASDAVLDRKRLPQVRMPNRDGFVSDPRPDVK